MLSTMRRTNRFSSFPPNENMPRQTPPVQKSYKLHKAVEYKSMHKVNILLPETKNVNEKNDMGCTVLHIACSQDSEDILELLLTNEDIDVDVNNNEGFNALHILAFRGNLKGIIQIMKRFPKVNIEDVTDKGNTPLVMASKMGHLDVIEYLHAKGANVNHKNSKKFTALHYAANGGYSRCLETLINFGADLDAQDDYGLTPLMKACKWGFVDCCKILLEKGAKVNLANKQDQTALRSACFRDYVEVTKLLISYKADVNYPGPYSTALIECAKNGNVGCARLLIEAGVNVTAKMRNGRSVKDIAKKKEFVDLVKKFFDKA